MGLHCAVISILMRLSSDDASRKNTLDSFLCVLQWISFDVYRRSWSRGCCLPTPMTPANEGSPIFPLVILQPASLSIWPAVQSLQQGLSTHPGVRMRYVCGCS